MEERLLTTKETAVRLGLSEQTFRNRIRGFYYREGAKVEYRTRLNLCPVYIGKMVRYREADVNKAVRNMPKTAD